MSERGIGLWLGWGAVRTLACTEKTQMQRPGLIKVAAGIQACLEGYQLAGFPGMHDLLNFRFGV
jgi:hypothetical protein